MFAHSGTSGATSTYSPLNLPTGLAADLRQRETDENPIRVGVIGCGEMGTDLVTQIARMQGLRITAIADRRLINAPAAFEIAGLDKALAVVCETPAAMSRAIEAGQTAVSPDAAMVATHDLVDVVVDATGRPAIGAEIGLLAMEHGKHLVMMNVEADVTIGAYLKHRADQLGVVYTVGAGDEPSSCMELINFVTALGYPVIAAGKGKNNPLNVDAVPDDYRAEAEQRNMNPRMLVEFVDGSKTMVEMCAIANATGLVPDVPGMHGPNASLETLQDVLCPREDGGVLSRKGVVDFTVGKGVAPGIFVIAELDHPRLMERMSDLKLGPGPYYTFYRPYHLTSLEVPLSCARAGLYGLADMCPLLKPTAEVCALAKRDLKPGDRLDFIGEYTYRAWTMTYEDARTKSARPCGLLEGASVIAPIKRGDLITTHNTTIDETTALATMRAEQDSWLQGC